MKSIQTLIFTILLFSSSLSAQGYKIGINAPDFAGKQIIIAEYFTSQMVPKDTLDLNLYGKGTFSGDKNFDGGLYVLYFDPGHFFDFMIAGDQVFNISIDSSNFTALTKFEGSEDNQLFFDYKIFLAQKREEQQKNIEAMKHAENASDSANIRQAVELLNTEMAEFIDNIIDSNPNLFVSVFLKAMKEVKAPEEALLGTERQKDSIRYMYYKNHYFDNFNVSDIMLLHTPLYEPKIKTYINKVAIQHPDSLILAVDQLIEKSRSNEAIFRYMLITLFNNYAESKMMGMDKVYFHIAKEYYIPEATWSSDEFIQDLKKNYEKVKYTFIDNKAPNFALKELPADHFIMAQMDTAIKRDPHIGRDFFLYQVEAKFTLLYYWEADCGHCQKATPVLYDVFKKYRDQGVKAVSVHVINSIEGKEKWIDFVNEHEMYDWINCWSPYNNEFRELYNLTSFPQLFILDKDKIIKAKNISPEQADSILENLLKIK